MTDHRLETDRGQVKEPAWLKDSIPRVLKAFEMYLKGELPSSIEQFMVATPLKHALRGVYGKSNLGVSWSWFRHELAAYVGLKLAYLRYKLGLQTKLEREVSHEVADLDVRHHADSGGPGPC